MSKYELNKHKKSDKVKWVMTLVVGILLAAGCAAALTMGIKNNGWFKPTENTPIEDTGGDVTNPDDNTGEENGGETTVKVLQSATFDSADGVSSNSFFTVSGNQATGTYTTPVGELTKALNVESSTTIAFTTEVATTVTIYTTETYVGKSIKVDGTGYTFASDDDGYIVAKAEITAGAHTISKGDTAVVTYLTLTTAEDTSDAYIRANVDFTTMGISAAKEMGFEINNLVTDANGHATYGAVPGTVWGGTVSGGNASITYTLTPEKGKIISDSVVSFKVGAGHAGGVYWYRSDGKLGANFIVSVSVDNSNWTKVFDLDESTQLIRKSATATTNTYTSDGISLKEYLQGGKQLYVKFDVMHFTPEETGEDWTAIALDKIGLSVFSIDIVADVAE